jgi:hypothetical protein
MESASLSDATNSYLGFDLQLGNVIRLGARDRVNLLCDLGYLTYGTASGGRGDVNFTPRLDWSHSFTPALSLLLYAFYTSNASNQAATFSYTRLAIGAGAHFAF